jgi:monoterpene epsilon-lactone hydrolase
MFPLVRFIQNWMPPGLAARFNGLTAARAHLPAGMRRESASADGVPCVWLIPEGAPPDRALLYLHGGGFVFGLSGQHIEMAAYLARRMGVRALLADYHLAPRHPYPAPLDDCEAAYRWLLAHGIPASDIALAGDSAGGNFVLALLMRLRAAGAPLPAAAACLSPAADLTERGKTDDPILPPRAIGMYMRSYLGGGDPRNPLISPVFGDYRGLPPLLLFAGEDEILREDSVRVAAAAKQAGIDVRLEIYPRMWHVWQLFLALPQAKQSLDDIAAFLGNRLGSRIPVAKPDTTSPRSSE